MRLLIALLFIILPIAAKPTCIIVFVFHNVIYAASDSKSTLSDINGKPFGERTIQKINHVGNKFFAVAGHDDQFLKVQATLELSVAGKIDSQIDSYAKSVKNHYQKLMLFEKKSSPIAYDRFLHNILSSVAFFGYADNIAYLKFVEFKMKEVSGVPKITFKIKDDEYFLPMGFRDHIDSIGNNGAGKILAKDPTNYQFGLVALLKMEMGFHSKYIGCPIRSMKMTNSDTQFWIDSCR